MTSASDDYRAHLLTLRSKLLDAITQGRLSDVEVGFGIYKQVVTGGFVFFHSVTTMLEPTSLRVHDVSSAHPEWRWVQRDIADFTEAAFDARQQGTRRALIDLVTSIVSTALTQRQFAALQEFLARMVDLWAAAIRAGDGESQGRILMELHSLGALQLTGAIRRSAGDQPPSELIWGAKLVVRTWTDMLRAAIDEGAAPPFDAAFEYFVDTFSGLERRALPEIRTLKGAAVLALLAWLDLRRPPDGQEQPDHFTGQLRQFPVDSAWQVLREVLDDETQALMRWDWWELSRTRPGKAIFLQFDTSALRAAAAWRTTLRVPRTGEADDTDENIARRLLDLDVVLPAPTRAALQGIIGEREAAARAALADTPIDAVHVEAFVTAVRETLAQEPSLLTLTNTEVETDPASEAPEPHRLGVHVAVARDYFVTTDAYADPTQLGREAALALRRGEDEQTLSYLRGIDALTQRSSTDHVAADVDAAIAAVGGDAVIVVLGSEEVAQVLRDAAQTESLLMHSIWDGTDTAEVKVLARRPLARRLFPADSTLTPLPELGVGVAVSDPPRRREEPHAVIRVETALQWLERLPQQDAMRSLLVPDAEW